MKALITGASSGIGRDIAIELDKLGIDCILVGTNKNELEKTNSVLKNRTEIIVCDLSKEKNVMSLFENTKKKNIDILINNAGFGLLGYFNDTDLKRELEMIDVNIKAVHILTKLFLKEFIKKNTGYILNVASSAGFMAGPNLSTYYATKNYVVSFTKAIYQELKEQKRDIHISALCPGPVDTNFNKRANGNFKTNGIKSSYVAKYAIKNMFKHKLLIIPDVRIKFVVFFSKFIPTKLLLKITSTIQKGKNLSK